MTSGALDTKEVDFFQPKMLRTSSVKAVHIRQPLPPLTILAKPIKSSTVLCPVPLDLPWSHSSALSKGISSWVRTQSLQSSANEELHSTKNHLSLGYLFIITSLSNTVPEMKLISALLARPLVPQTYV